MTAHTDRAKISFDALRPGRGTPRMFVWGDLLEAALAFAPALGGAAMVGRRLAV